ncbi:substrate-binding domain-containing protein [Nocardioides sp.]|uniref:substrate-binding domain-containing protein n=1 Tax=Nocardioides sp. TaxID=35761 RepID=UPI0035B00D8A
MNNLDERDGGRASMRTPVLVVLLLVTGIVVGGGAAYLLMSRDGTSAAGADSCGAYDTIELTVGPELYGAVLKAVEETAPECTRVEPDLRPGIDVAKGVALGGAVPDIWIPESRFLTTKAYVGNARLRVLARSLAHTPVLLVGGKSARRFDSWGDAETSGLVSVPDPETTVAGTLAVVAPQAEARAVGRSVVDARQLVVPFAQTYGARRSRGDDAEVAPAMFARSSSRLVVTTEQELASVQGRSDLRDLTPAVGAPALDFPMAVSEDAEPAAREVARALADYLGSPDGRAELNAEGLRATGDQRSPGSVSTVTTVLPTPTGASISGTVQSWRTLAVPSSILAVVDASGSMDFSAGTGTRMDLLADAAGIGLSFLPDHARVGLWVFSIDKGGPGRDWRELEPIRRLDDLRFGRTQRYALRQRAMEMPGLTDGGTGLYDTALAAYKEAVRSYRPHYSNAVVLMTDGQNEDPGSIGLRPLLAQLKALRDPDRPVRLVGIAISGDADLAALEQMAHVTGGEAYLAAQPQDILEVFAKAVLSR